MQSVAKKIIEIITGNFYNGIRDDFIDTSKILRIYSANYSDENISRGLIANVIHENGIETGGRFYFIPDSTAENLKHFIDKIFNRCSIVYYSAVHGKHPDFFSRLHIFSPGVLKKILLKTDADHFYSAEFCSDNKKTRLEHEISKIFAATKKSLSFEFLQSRLPYVPAEKILAVLSDSKKYLTTDAGTYISVSKIQFDFEEIFEAKRQISSRIAAKGFALPEDYDLSSNFSLNPELDEKILRNIIYEKFFADDFTKSRKKLLKKNFGVKKNEMSAMSSFREFVAAQNKLSDDKLFAFAKSLGLLQRDALSVAHEKMIRVEKNLFVKKNLVNFDIAGVDEALSAFVQGKIIPLRSVTSFANFPPVTDYSWNLFLLESFLLGYSKKFSYDAPTVNSSNLGAIYPKFMKFGYLDVQAAVVVQENIPLEKFAIENFLVAQGFRANRLDKVTDRIIARAYEFSNRRDHV